MVADRLPNGRPVWGGGLMGELGAVGTIGLSGLPTHP
jgi:hypothetical protein